MNDQPMRTRELAKVLGVPLRTLHSWIELGLLDPPLSTAVYPPAFFWNAKHVAEARQVAALRNLGVSVLCIRKAQTYLRDLGHNPLSQGQIVVVGGRVGRKQKELVKVLSQRQAFALLKQRGQLLLLVPHRGEV